jgi:hypothetical protein
MSGLKRTLFFFWALAFWALALEALVDTGPVCAEHAALIMISTRIKTLVKRIVTSHGILESAVG